MDSGFLFALTEANLSFCHNSTLMALDAGHRTFDFNFTVINRGNIPTNVCLPSLLSCCRFCPAWSLFHRDPR